jgi:hypothetical protein
MMTYGSAYFVWFAIVLPPMIVFVGYFPRRQEHF